MLFTVPGRGGALAAINMEGILYAYLDGAYTGIRDVSDGTSNTIIVGERDSQTPMTPDANGLPRTHPAGIWVGSTQLDGWTGNPRARFSTAWGSSLTAFRGMRR